MARPPAALVTACRSAPCAAAMACTMASPRPSPPGARRAGSIRWKGRNSLPSWSGGMTGPELVTARNGRPARQPVVTCTWPPAALYLIALSTRLATSRSASAGSPAVAAGRSRAATLSWAACASSARPASTSPARTARSNGSKVSRPRSPRASVSRAAMRCSCCCSAARARSQAVRSEASVACGSRSATSSRVRCLASGVRSSCDAFATNWR